MNNKTKYKQAMSGVHHSGDLVERIMDMTENKKKGINIKPLVAGAVCVVVAVTAIFGGSAISASLKPVTPNQVTTQQGSSSKLTDSFIMIAYANDEAKPAKPLKLGVETPLDYRLEVYDIRNKSEAEINEIVEKLKDSKGDFLNNSDNEVRTALRSIERLDNIILRRSVINSFMLNVDKDKKVKSISLKTGTEYWTLGYKDLRDSTKPEKQFPKGYDLEISGKDYYEILDWMKEAGWNDFEIYLEHDVNLCSAIDKNPDIDYKVFDDDLTFTIEYEDGTVEQNVVSVSMNDNGKLSVICK